MSSMSLQRVFFAFFVLLALSMNFGFFYGQTDNAFTIIPMSCLERL